MIDTTCRVCKGDTKQIGLLFRCIKKKCGAVFWDKTAVKKKIKENPRNKEVIIRDAEIPDVQNGAHFVYILRMRQRKKKQEIDKPFVPTEYIGETALHPYKRYLNHIIGNKHSKRHRTDKYATALTYFKGAKMTREVGIDKERALIAERKKLGIRALGGHKDKEKLVEN